MQTARLVFVKREWNLASLAIRCALPRSILRPALSSHVIVDLGDGDAIEATMLHRVRKVPLSVALKGSKTVATREFLVNDRATGDIWLEKQVDKPYDFEGAFGLVDPDREWQKDDAWYCYELGAAYLVKCGLDIFADRGHITERELLGVNPQLILAFR